MLLNVMHNCELITEQAYVENIDNKVNELAHISKKLIYPPQMEAS